MLCEIADVRRVGPIASANVSPRESVTELTDAVPSFHPAITTSRFPALCGDCSVTATALCADCGVADAPCRYAGPTSASSRLLEGSGSAWHADRIRPENIKARRESVIVEMPLSGGQSGGPARL